MEKGGPHGGPPNDPDHADITMTEEMIKSQN